MAIKKTGISSRILYIIIILLALPACKKDEQNSGVNANDLAGTYIGSKTVKRITNTGTAVYRDSVTTTDTFIVTAVTADTILLIKPSWDIAQPGFKTDTGYIFTRQRGTPSFNDHLDELTLSFDARTHSIQALKHHVAVSSWIMEDYEQFAGQR